MFTDVWLKIESMFGIYSVHLHHYLSCLRQPNRWYQNTSHKPVTNITIRTQFQCIVITSTQVLIWKSKILCEDIAG